MEQAGSLGRMVIQLPIGSHEDVVVARQQVRDIAAGLGFRLLDQTRIVTAVSELARNIVVHAGSGVMTVIRPMHRAGLQIVFQDHGPGIAEVGRAMQESYSTAGSLGLGLPGAKRLADAMEIVSVPGQGTTITITKWL